MVHSSKCTPALLALAGMQAVGGAIVDLICAKATDYTPSASFGTSETLTCQDVVDRDLKDYVDHTASMLDADTCKTLLTATTGSVTVESGMNALGTQCCGGKDGAFLCGYPFSLSPCATTDEFRYSSKVSGHCDGDENADKATCIAAAGEGAWNDFDEERCDISRVGGSAAQSETMCKAAGGTWAPSTCYDFMSFMSGLSYPTCSSKQTTFMLGMTKRMLYTYLAPKCCITPSSECPMFALNPCENLGDYTPNHLIQGTNTCEQNLMILASETSGNSWCDLGPERSIDCLQRPTNYGGEITTKQMFDYLASECCSNKTVVGACSANGCMTTTTTAGIQEVSGAQRTFAALTLLVATTLAI